MKQVFRLVTQGGFVFDNQSFKKDLGIYTTPTLFQYGGDEEEKREVKELYVLRIEISCREDRCSICIVDIEKVNNLVESLL